MAWSMRAGMSASVSSVMAAETAMAEHFDASVMALLGAGVT